ncbi:hypothetical protein BUALT_Bualt01G0091800 [Buddleja alternifolia]|uniref:RBR-type E3 ubiquitin transferase n=1 Tax=Buddleja alternifolia TaxID=168488 RepID=A0AAV6Y6R8_9LAMI|nr:hypothetical protein BUALT_Bualt01G0091800 [Buddleja alternifolia]
MDSEEEDFYYSSGDGEAEESAEGGGDELESDSATISHHRKNYTILKEEDIRKLHDGDISTVANVLSVSRGVACFLLCKNNWSLSTVYNEWFADDEKPLETVAKRKSGNQVCKICYESVVVENMLSVACGHLFCSDCWKTYISTSITKDGVGCLTLRCPEPSCKAPAGLDMAELLATADEKEKLNKYLIRSYIEGNRKRKWCPAPGCEFSVQFNSDGCDSYDVVCDCDYKFCWKCMEESHRPIDCETVEKWVKKSSCDGESATWILAYTKPCPKCHKSIEKNQGCNHMTCRCRHQFCWTCLASWNKHNQCNQYSVGKDVIEKRENAKLGLQRYAHYYDRWVSNDKSMKLALIDLSRARAEHVGLLVRVHGESEGQVKFVTEAWEQIVECRRVLKWTYAYGYYMDTDTTNSAKVSLFGYLQGQAESALERLHHSAEKEMEKFLKAECASKDFSDFRSKLAMLTGVTGNYFENLVSALENNLSEVQSSSDKSQTAKQEAHRNEEALI